MLNNSPRRCLSLSKGNAADRFDRLNKRRLDLVVSPMLSLFSSIGLGTMHDFIQSALITLYLLAALSSGVNAAYFGTMPTPRRSQKIGAAVLSLVSFGTLLHSSYGGLALLIDMQPASAMAPVTQLAAVVIQGVITLGSLAITALVARRVLAILQH